VGSNKTASRDKTAPKRADYNSGLLNKQSAAQLGASEKTIKVHRGQVMQKMKAESLAHLIHMAERLGFRAN
jgi:FixJ family two-component response regulator